MRRFVSLVSILPALFAVALLAGCAAESASDDPESAATTDAPLTTVRMEVSGMTCGGCEQAIRTAVEKLPGVESVEASHADGEAIVKLTGGAERTEELKSTIESLGYTVEGLVSMEPL